MPACPAPGQCPCGTATFWCPTLKCWSCCSLSWNHQDCREPKFLLEMPLWIKAGWHSLGSAPLADPGTDGLQVSPKRALGAQGQHREVLSKHSGNSSPAALQQGTGSSWSCRVKPSSAFGWWKLHPVPLGSQMLLSIPVMPSL